MTTNTTDNYKLKLYIKSFSYKNGIPNAVDQHGGGFVFDCRALLNPGREASFTYKTGLDIEIAEFLEAQNDAAIFWQASEKLVDLAVLNYQKRKFSSLSVFFGCTGGQHRSVYFAEKLSKLYQSTDGVEVKLEHLNSCNWRKS